MCGARVCVAVEPNAVMFEGIVMVLVFYGCESREIPVRMRKKVYYRNFNV